MGKGHDRDLRVRRSSDAANGQNRDIGEEATLPHRHKHNKPRDKRKRKDRKRNRDKQRRRDRHKRRNRERKEKHFHEKKEHDGSETLDSVTPKPIRTNVDIDLSTAVTKVNHGRDTANVDDDYSAYDYFNEENRFALKKKHRRERKRQELISENDSAPRDYAKLFQSSDYNNGGSLDLTRQNPNIEVAIEILHENYTSSEYTEVEDAGPNDFPIGQDMNFDEFAKAFQNQNGGGIREVVEDEDHDAGGGDKDDDDDDDDGSDDHDYGHRDDGEEDSEAVEFKDSEGPTEDYYSYNVAPTDIAGDNKDTSKEVTTDNRDSKNYRGPWSEWSECSATCGGGTKERHRSCGNSCTSTESRDCYREQCPDDSRQTEGTGHAGEYGVFSHSDIVMEEIGHDSCEAWMKCRSESLTSYLAMLQDLPSCPCFYPTNIPYNDSIWDHQKQKMFRWMDASERRERLDIYKPTARYCIRSKLSMRSTSLAAQHCCYDDEMRLITRGPGAGTPNLISTEVSYALHKKIDIMPWINCKGDWTRYNQIRPPNNLRGCTEVPDTETFLKLYRDAKNY
ncbi:isthmin-1-like isoform X2 [Ptychodera flava]